MVGKPADSKQNEDNEAHLDNLPLLLNPIPTGGGGLFVTPNPKFRIVGSGA